MKNRKVGIKEFTAAGTVADFHGIPYYPQGLKTHFGTNCKTKLFNNLKN